MKCTFIEPLILCSPSNVLQLKKLSMVSIKALSIIIQWGRKKMDGLARRLICQLRWNHLDQVIPCSTFNVCTSFQWCLLFTICFVLPQGCQNQIRQKYNVNTKTGQYSDSVHFGNWFYGAWWGSSAFASLSRRHDYSGLAVFQTTWLLEFALGFCGFRLGWLSCRQWYPLLFSWTSSSATPLSGHLVEIQSSVVGALSTAEAEFAAASSMVEQITYLSFSRATWFPSFDSTWVFEFPKRRGHWVVIAKTA